MEMIDNDADTQKEITQTSSILASKTRNTQSTSNPSSSGVSKRKSKSASIPPTPITTRSKSKLMAERNDENKTRYECMKCKRRFSRLNYLKIHQTTHTKEKAFECNLCGKKFTQLASLNRHKKKTHIEI